MNNRTQPYYNNSLAIRQEIQRFESVHPSIYAIYDLLEVMPDPLLAQQIREHVVCIEGESYAFDGEQTSSPNCERGLEAAPFRPLRPKWALAEFSAPAAAGLDDFAFAHASHRQRTPTRRGADD
ncbi:hypothetical protein HPB50_011071 [Hyalomma asiaticum]|uniref:Uncharacterized protein n=1 Tax=Hyalomma asiaticum TaxID=266040 RepID=A0ACB7S8R1_HYAAI|nr:hypothetical protein HPB50_011071 [Hyalomma asiaticum]